MALRLQRLEEALPRIEALLRAVDDRLRKVEIDLAEIRGRIANLPSTWAMITTMLGGQVAFAAAILVILRIVGAH
jgi:chromosome condensin MukBEF ATPase and DNA-binding subunit MukB